MCGKRHDNPSHEERQQRQESASSSMSGYGARELPYLPRSTPVNPALTTAFPFQWTNPSTHPQTTGSESLLTCMTPNTEGSPAASSYSGFHCSPFQFSYDCLRESAAAGVYGSKMAVGLNVQHKPNNMLRHRQVLVNGPSGLLMDGLAGGKMNVTKMTAQEIIDAKALAASKNHSEAERRRRERINTHLATLRSLLPSTTKTDKASLLAEVIEHVKDLKRQASEIAEQSPVPTEIDELTVDPDPSCSNGRLLVRASLCCDDRPDLLSDIIKALRTLRLRTLKAEITTLGARVKNVLLVTNVGESSDVYNNCPSVSCIHEALKSVMERQNSEQLSPGNSIGIKRQRPTHFGPNEPLRHILDHRSI